MGYMPITAAGTAFMDNLKRGNRPVTNLPVPVTPPADTGPHRLPGHPDVIRCAC